MEDPEPDAKTSENVRVHKKAEPYIADDNWRVENEFVMTLSIDVGIKCTDGFTGFTYAKASGEIKNKSDQKISAGSLFDKSDIKTNVTITDGIPATGSGDKCCTVTIKDHNGNVLISGLKLYWSDGNQLDNVLLKVDSDQYILLGQLKKDETREFTLDATAETAVSDMLDDYVAARYNTLTSGSYLQSVVDQMGDYITYEGNVSGDFDVTPTFNFATDTLTWIPKAKTNVTPEDDTTTGMKWYNGVSKLSYRVRLTTDKRGFVSCADDLDDKVYDPQDPNPAFFETNDHATLTYGNNKTIDFPEPHVRGLLYSIHILKVDTEGNPLEGAVFEITETNPQSDGSSALPAEKLENGHYTVTSGADGYVKFEGLVALDGKFDGCFTITEISTPKDYIGIEEPILLSIGDYTRNPADFEIDGDEMLYNPTNATEAAKLTATNALKPKIRFFKKIMGTEVALPGAEFALYEMEGDERTEEPLLRLISNENGILLEQGSEEDLSAENEDALAYFSLDAGQYELVETKTPDGYYPPATSAILTVDEEGHITESHYKSPYYLLDQPNKNIPTYSMTIFNTTGFELPETGGFGTLPIYIGSVLLMAGAFVCGFLRRRRHA